MKLKPKNVIEFEGLGTRWWVELLERDEFPTELADFVRSTIKLFDDTYSRFKHDSLIGHLNTHKRLLQPPQELLDMFAFAHKMHIATEGTFDISVGGTLQRLGYGDTKTAKSVYARFWNQSIYNTDEIAIPTASAVDLGGFGKGWLLDKLALLLERRGYQYYLINGGGDIVVNVSDELELGLEHPYDPTKVIGRTKLTRGALAVSSTVKRRWLRDGKTENHIIDPINDNSTRSTVISSYVRGQTALIADTLSTVVLLRPELKAKVEKQFNVETIIVTKDQLH